MARRPGAASFFRGLIPTLPRPVWTLIICHACACVGAGIVFAFLVVYLHYVRGISLGDAGIAFAGLPVGAMIMGPLAGALVDRLGSRLIIAAGALVAAVGIAALPLVHAAWQATTVALVLGAGMTCLESPLYTLLATSVTGAQRSAVFSLDYAVIALGWGAGGFIGGLVVDIGRPATFEVAFLCAAAAYAGFAAVALAVTPARVPDELPEVCAPAPASPAVAGPGAEGSTAVLPDCDPASGAEAPQGYRAVLADRCMRRILALEFILMAFAYVQFDITFPAVAIGAAHVGTKVIGIAFLANMIVVAGGQLFVLRYLQGKRRTRAMVMLCLFSAVCWALVLAAAHVGGGTAAAALLVLAFMVIGCGEMMWAPSVPGMVNDLAPAAIRGRYNATNAFSDAAGKLVGPVLAGFMLESGLTDLWLFAIVAVCFLVIPIVFGLERRVPDAANRVGGGAPPPAMAPPL